MRICLVRIDKMGDMILTLPIIQGLKKANNNCKIDVVCSQRNLKICKKFNTINNIILFSSQILGIFQTIQKIRKENYDYIFTFSPGILSIFISIFFRSKTKSLLILQSRYKNNFKSKLFERIIGKLFYKYSSVINRKKRFIEKNSIHQTELMNELVKTSGLEIKDDEEIKNIFNLEKKDYGLKKLCLIHLSSKWLNKYFSEDRFINFIEKIKNFNINIVLTSDESSKNVFVKIYKKYDLYNDKQFKDLVSINEIIILDNLNFNNWISIINSSSYVITPECGCTHIASLTSCKLCVIYDSDNSPDMIANEYAPWKKHYTKLLSNDKNLEEKLISFIN